MPFCCLFETRRVQRRATMRAQGAPPNHKGDVWTRCSRACLRGNSAPNSNLIAAANLSLGQPRISCLTAVMFPNRRDLTFKCSVTTGDFESRGLGSHLATIVAFPVWGRPARLTLADRPVLRPLPFAVRPHAMNATRWGPNPARKSAAAPFSTASAASSSRSPISKWSSAVTAAMPTSWVMLDTREELLPIVWKWIRVSYSQCSSLARAR
jgi:hypothetical protein